MFFQLRYVLPDPSLLSFCGPSWLCPSSETMACSDTSATPWCGQLHREPIFQKVPDCPGFHFLQPNLADPEHRLCPLGAHRLVGNRGWWWWWWKKRMPRLPQTQVTARALRGPAPKPEAQWLCTHTLQPHHRPCTLTFTSRLRELNLLQMT